MATLNTLSRLYHATRMSDLDAIMRDGLLAKFHGKVHGRMEYTPAGDSVYLSRFEDSNNLNGKLFADPDDPVIVLEIDASPLDQGLVYPDTPIYQMLEEQFLPDPDSDDPKLMREAIAEFRNHFGLKPRKARRILVACNSASATAEYPAICREMWPEYLTIEGEIAYLGDVPASAIIGWKPHPMRQASRRAA